MKKIYYLFACLLLSTGFLHAQDKKVWSLQECIDYAIKNNIQVKQQELSIEDADLNIKDAKGAFLPDLNANASNNWNRGFSDNGSGGLIEANSRGSRYGAVSNITLFNGFKNYRVSERARIQKLIAEYGVESLKDDISLNLANAYLQVLLNKENLSILKAQNELTKEQIDRTNELIEAGVVPRGDVLELKANYANENQQIIDVENSVSLSILSIKQLLNYPFEKEFELENSSEAILDEGFLDVPFETLLEGAISKRNEIKRVEENLNLASKDIEIVKSDLLPVLTGSASYGTSEIRQEEDPVFRDPESGEDVVINQDSFFDQLNQRKNLTFGAQLQIPIFNRNRVRNSISRAKVAKMRSEFELEQAKQRLTQQVYQAYLDAKTSQKSYESAQVAKSAQQTAFEYAKNRFEAGVSNSFEFNQVKLRLQNSEIDLVRTKYDFLFRLKLLELYYTGKISE